MRSKRSPFAMRAYPPPFTSLRLVSFPFLRSSPVIGEFFVPRVAHREQAGHQEIRRNGDPKHALHDLRAGKFPSLYIFQRAEENQVGGLH